MALSKYDLHNDNLRYKAYRNLDQSIQWNDREVELAYNYLTNPVKEGVWKGEFKWNFGEGITEYIREELEKAAKNGFKLKSRTIKVSSGQLEELVAKTETFSFLFRLFANLLNNEEQAESLDEYLNANDEDDLILSVLDMNKLRREYAAALTSFGNSVYTDGFQTTIRDNVSKVKNGMFYIPKAPRKYLNSPDYLNIYEHDTTPKKVIIEIFALEKGPLETISNFLNLLGKISSPVCYKVYSPEEELLSIYTKITKEMLSYVIRSEAIRALFTKMMSDYENGNPTAAISAAGQIGEECLTQIYETLYRRPVPQNMTLGALRDSVSELTKKMKKVKTNTISSKADVQKIIKDKLSTVKQVDKRTVTQISKALLELSDFNQRTLAARIRTLEGLDNDYGIFPHVIRVNLNNLLRLRNNVSHKSIDPVGMAEALQCVYYSLSLYIWWDTQRKKLDWNKDESGIVQELIAAAEIDS